MTADEVNRRETDNFLDWRREISQMEEKFPSMKVMFTRTRTKSCDTWKVDVQKAYLVLMTPYLGYSFWKKYRGVAAAVEGFREMWYGCADCWCPKSSYVLHGGPHEICLRARGEYRAVTIDFNWYWQYLPNPNTTHNTWILQPPRPVMLLVNKADLLTEYQRRAWARHFESIGVRFAFYSAQIEQDK